MSDGINIAAVRPDLPRSDRGARPGGYSDRIVGRIASETGRVFLALCLLLGIALWAAPSWAGDEIPTTGCNGPCCNNPDSCCGNNDPCCGSQDPCCGSQSCECQPDPSAGNPVRLLSGIETERVVDLELSGGLFPIRLERAYNSRTSYDSPLGYGWGFERLYERLYKYADGSVTVRRECGQKRRFVYSGGAYVTPALVEMPGQTATVCEECFAPILYVLTYDDLDEAIAIQNAVHPTTEIDPEDPSTTYDELRELLEQAINREGLL